MKTSFDATLHIQWSSGGARIVIAAPGFRDVVLTEAMVDGERIADLALEDSASRDVVLRLADPDAAMVISRLALLLARAHVESDAAALTDLV